MLSTAAFEGTEYAFIANIANLITTTPEIVAVFGGTAVAGAVKSAVGKATAMRAAIPREVQDAVTARMRDVIAPPPPTRTPADIDAEVDARVQAELRRRGVVDLNGKPEGGF